MSAFVVTGIDPQGRAKEFALTCESAAVLAVELHAQGWQQAEITLDGRPVGGVGLDGYCQRTWWGDKAGLQPAPAPKPKPVRRRARALTQTERTEVRS